MSDLRQLIEAARAEAPSAAARAKVWGGVSSVVGEAAMAAGAGGAAGSIGAVKMLVLGTLLGGALTVGVGAAVLVARPATPGPGGPRVTSLVPAPAPATQPLMVAWTSTDELQRPLKRPSEREAPRPRCPRWPK